jgi:hypothetical protein
MLNIFLPEGKKNIEVSFTIFIPNIAVISFLIGDQLPPHPPPRSFFSKKMCKRWSIIGKWFIYPTLKRANRVCSY